MRDGSRCRCNGIRRCERSKVKEARGERVFLSSERSRQAVLEYPPTPFHGLPAPFWLVLLVYKELDVYNLTHQMRIDCFAFLARKCSQVQEAWGVEMGL